MRLSDFQRATENISTEASLIALDRNATAAGRVVNWRTMKIGETQGARESNPFRPLRQVLMDATGIDSDRMHRILDRVMDSSESPSHRKYLHNALDALIAGAEEREPDEEESDEDDDEEEEAEMASDAELNREFQSAVRHFGDVVRRSIERIPVVTPRETSVGRSYAQDADSLVINKYLRPEQCCKDALSSLSGKLFPANGDRIALGHWSGISTFLASFPQETPIRHVPQRTLAPLIRHLEKNRASA
jgi:hypothetical protein